MEIRDVDLHAFSIEELGAMKRQIEEYIGMYFGFEKKLKAKRTEEWIEGASRRLEGEFVYCCECIEKYPKADLHFRDEIYCPKCRKEQ